MVLRGPSAQRCGEGLGIRGDKLTCWFCAATTAVNARSSSRQHCMGWLAASPKGIVASSWPCRSGSCKYSKRLGPDTPGVGVAGGGVVCKERTHLMRPQL